LRFWKRAFTKLMGTVTAVVFGGSMTPLLC
jgi:hypothetical protein